ncbi:MAG TPA: carbonic anhydrase [Ilumatobacteraceae bacterium]|nr:carbonic anhydrase [Ilumatobacteraceae bacterium]
MVDEPFHPNIDELLEHNARYADTFEPHGAVRPSRRMVVVACMDSRMDIFQMLGLENGEAHIIRNAGGVVTDDVIRSLVVSQRRLDTREIVLIHHTNCGLEGVSADDFHQELEDEVGIRPAWALEAFSDPYADVRQSINRLKQSPFVRYKDHISGFVWDVNDGQLHPV